MTDENWLAGTLTPKSDQLNADDLISGPITVTIEGVIKRDVKDQPVEMRLAGIDRPYKPCLTMRRMMHIVWGTLSPAKVIGRKLTLVNDPSVVWGGKAVGGIRIHAMSHIESSVTMAMTVTRGNRKPFTVYPIVIQEPSFLEKWRDEFGGAASDVMAAAKEIAAAFTANDLELLKIAELLIDEIAEHSDEDHLKALRAFAVAVKNELSV